MKHFEWLRIADRRMGAVIEAFRRGWSVERVNEITESRGGSCMDLKE